MYRVNEDGGPTRVVTWRRVDGWAEENIRLSWAESRRVTYATGIGVFSREAIDVDAPSRQLLDGGDFGTLGGVSVEGRLVLASDRELTLIDVRTGATEVLTVPRVVDATWHGDAITVSQYGAEPPGTELVDLAAPGYSTPTRLPLERPAGAEDSSPRWSADGECLAFVRDREAMVYSTELGTVTPLGVTADGPLEWRP